MTGKNLPPTTERELSRLKQRVTDLERVLERARAKAATPPAAPTSEPFLYVALPGSGGSPAPQAAESTTPDDITGFVVRIPDPAGRIVLLPPADGVDGDRMVFAPELHGRWFQISARVEASPGTGDEALIVLRRGGPTPPAWPDGEPDLANHNHWYLFASGSATAGELQGSRLIRVVAGAPYRLAVDLPGAGARYWDVEWWASALPTGTGETPEGGGGF